MTSVSKEPLSDMLTIDPHNYGTECLFSCTPLYIGQQQCECLEYFYSYCSLLCYASIAHCGVQRPLLTKCR